MFMSRFVFCHIQICLFCVAFRIHYARVISTVLSPSQVSRRRRSTMQYTQAQIGEATWNYGMDSKNPADVTAVREWLQHTYAETFIAYAIIMPGVHTEYGEGIYVCVSTRESASQQNLNMAAKVIINPEYYSYWVYFHPGVAMLNWAGITHGGFEIGSFEDVLSEWCAYANIPGWRVTYRPKADEWHNAGLQRLLAALNIPMHIKIMAGLSKYAYRGLDLYTRVVVGNQAVSGYDAHDIVFSSWMPWAGQVPYPPDW